MFYFKKLAERIHSLGYLEIYDLKKSTFVNSKHQKS
jgi:hypothetical protein